LVVRIILYVFKLFYHFTNTINYPKGLQPNVPSKDESNVFKSVGITYKRMQYALALFTCLMQYFLAVSISYGVSESPSLVTSSITMNDPPAIVETLPEDIPSISYT